MQNDVKDTPVAIKMRTPSSLIAAALHKASHGTHQKERT